MSLTLNLPNELAALLSEDASRAGMSLSDYAVHLLTTARKDSTAVQTGADLVSYWKSEGVVGTLSGIPESEAHARDLRERAQQRNLE
jgi:hypothetical protein